MTLHTKLSKWDKGNCWGKLTRKMQNNSSKYTCQERRDKHMKYKKLHSCLGLLKLFGGSLGVPNQFEKPWSRLQQAIINSIICINCIKGIYFHSLYKSGTKHFLNKSFEGWTGIYRTQLVPMQLPEFNTLQQTGKVWCCASIHVSWLLLSN